MSDVPEIELSPSLPEYLDLTVNGEVHRRKLFDVLDAFTFLVLERVDCDGFRELLAVPEMTETQILELSMKIRDMTGPGKRIDLDILKKNMETRITAFALAVEALQGNPDWPGESSISSDTTSSDGSQQQSPKKPSTTLAAAASA